MKLKKYLSSLLALTLLASCSNDGIIDNNTPIDSVPEGAVAFNVSLPGRTFEPATYAGTFAAEVAEKSLSEVRIYVFDNTTTNKPGKLVATEKVTSVGTGNTEAGVTGKFYMRHLLGSPAHLVAAANLALTADEANALIGIPFEKFSGLLITQSPSTANKFPMVSEPLKVTVPKTGATTPANITFLLERLAVRIDIKNETNNTGTNKEFVVEEARTKVGSLSQSYLIKGQTPVLAKNDALGTKEVGIKKWITNNASNKKEMFAKVYTYENGNTNFVLEVRGKIDNKPAAFEIPFGKKLVRNTRYLVKIQNAGLGNLVKFDVEVVDWKDGGNVIVGSDSYAATKPLVKSVVVANSTGVAGGVKAHTEVSAGGTVNSITLTKRDAYHTRVLVTSDVESKITVTGAMVPWVTVKEVALTPEEEAANFGAKAYHIAFAKNDDTYDRTATLVVEPKDNTEAGKRQNVTVTQKGATYAEAVNPLGLFSNALLNGVKTFAPAVTEENAHLTPTHGKLFQWGKNTPIDFNSLQHVADQIPTNSPLLKTPVANRAYGKGKPNWTTETFTTTTTWESIVMKSNAGDAYTGTNSVKKGDPSPEGWKIPTNREGLVLVPGNETAQFTDGIQRLNRKLDNVVIKGNSPKSYINDFLNKDGIIYAIKQKATTGSDNTYLTAYRYEWTNRRLKIVARHLGEAGKATTINQVANEAWWNDVTKSGSDVIRLLPVTNHFTPTNTYNNSVTIWFNSISNNNSPLSFVVNENDAKIFSSSASNGYSILPIRAK